MFCVALFLPICPPSFKTELGFSGEVAKPVSEAFCHTLPWPLQWVSMCLISPLGRNEQCSPTRALCKSKGRGSQRVVIKGMAGWEREDGVRVGETGRREMRWLEGAAVGSVLWQQRGFGSSTVASFFFTVSSKSWVPEGDFERSDLPLFSSFVPAAHAVGWNLKRTRHVGESSFVATSLLHVVKTFAFLKHAFSHLKTVYFKTSFITYNDTIVEVFYSPEHGICPVFTVMSYC